MKTISAMVLTMLMMPAKGASRMPKLFKPIKGIVTHWKPILVWVPILLLLVPFGVSPVESATVANLVVGRFFISGNNRFTDQDIATKSDMFMNHVENGSRIQQIHGINPNLIALLYRSARSVNSRDLEYQTFLSNGWILKDPNGRLIYDSKFTDNFIVDVGSTGYHQWVANWIKTQLDKYGYNGVNFDLLLPSTEILWRTTPSPAINPRTKKAWTDAEFQQAIIALVNKTKAAIGNRFVVGNSLWRGEHFFGSRYSGFAALLTQSKLDGTEAEAWIMERDNVGWYSETMWKQSIDLVVWLENNFLNKSGKMFLPVAQNAEPYNGQGTALPSGCTKEQYALYAYASLLLGSRTNSHYLNLGWYLPEDFPQSLFKIDLGSPSGAYYMVNGTHVYARNFSKTKVLVNPTNQSYTVNVGAGYQNFDGTAVGTSITVPAHTGKILKKTGSSPNPAVTSLTVSPNPFSPNGDGTKDTATINASFNVVVNWNLQARTLAGVVVRTWNGTGSSLSVVWNGKNGSGVLMADGTYNLSLIGSNLSGISFTTTKIQVTIDTKLPTVTGVSVSPTSFNPRLGQITKISYTLSEPCYVTIKIYTSGGTLVRTSLNNVLQAAGARSVVWNGKNSAGVIVPHGTYSIRIWVIDKAGNKATPYPIIKTVTVL